jgi:hypothetical protein
MTTPLTRRAAILGAISLAGCNGTTLAEAPPVTLDKLEKLASALNNNLLQRQDVAASPEAYEQAADILAMMKNLPPPAGSDSAAFEDRKQRYAAIAASHAIAQGTGSLVVQIAKEFPELTDGPITLPGIGKYDLNRDLAAHYATNQPDEPLKSVQAQLAAIRSQYQAQFDDGASVSSPKVRDPNDNGLLISPDDLINRKKTGLTRT